MLVEAGLKLSSEQRWRVCVSVGVLIACGEGGAGTGTRGGRDGDLGRAGTGQGEIVDRECGVRNPVVISEVH